MHRMAMAFVVLTSICLASCATSVPGVANVPRDVLALYGRLDSDGGQYFVQEICALRASYGVSQYRRCAESELTRSNGRFFNLTTLDIPAEHNHIECPAATWSDPSRKMEQDIKYCSDYADIYEVETIKSAIRVPIQTLVTLGTYVNTPKTLDREAFVEVVRRVLPDDQRQTLLDQEAQYRTEAPERREILDRNLRAKNAERDRVAQRMREANLQDAKSVGDTVCTYESFGTSFRGQIDAISGGRYRVLVSGVKDKHSTSHVATDQRVYWFDPGQVYRCF